MPDDMRVRFGGYWTLGNIWVIIHQLLIDEQTGMELWIGRRPMGDTIIWYADGNLHPTYYDALSPRYKLRLGTWSAPGEPASPRKGTANWK